jgi:hypothetical protein
MAQVDFQQEDLFRQPSKPSRLLKKGVLQHNKLPGYPSGVVLMQMNDVLHQKNSAGLQDRLF